MLIENSVSENSAEQENLVIEATNIMEDMIGMGLTSTMHTVLVQCSPAIFEVN